MAARYGHLNILKILHQRGGDLNIVTNKGWSPLMLAASAKHTSVAEYLLANNVDERLQNNINQTAADSAAKYQTQSIFELLSLSTSTD